MRFLEPEQLAALADAHPVFYRPHVLTAGYVGLRWGELVGLALENVDLLRRTIRVERQLLEVGGAVRFGPPNEGRRSDGHDAAGSRGDTRRALRVGRRCSPPGSRSQGQRGALLRRSNFRRVWTKARTRAGFDGGPLDGLVFHELRHTAAALAIAQGAHPLAIKERLGHSSTTVTMDGYGGPVPCLEEAIGDGLDAVLRESLAGPTRDGGETVARLCTSEG